MIIPLYQNDELYWLADRRLKESDLNEGLFQTGELNERLIERYGCRNDNVNDYLVTLFRRGERIDADVRHSSGGYWVKSMVLGTGDVLYPAAEKAEMDILEQGLAERAGFKPDKITLNRRGNGKIECRVYKRKG